MARDRHRVTETERIALAHVVDVGEVGGELHLLEQRVLARRLEVVLELEVAVEVVFDGALVATGDDQDVGETGLHGLFHDVLDRGPVDDREHLLRRALRGRKEARAEPRGRDHGFPRLTGSASALLQCRVDARCSSARTCAEIVLLAPQQPSNVTEVTLKRPIPRARR